MFINEQLEILLDKLGLPTNKYHTPYCASCPICGGGNTLRIRTSFEKLASYHYLECCVCRVGGTVSDWLDILENEFGARNNKNKKLSDMYTATFDNFEKLFFSNPELMNKVGYTHSRVPESNSFSLVDIDWFHDIKPVTYLKDCDCYIVVPTYKHPHLIDDFIVSDGFKWERVGSRCMSIYRNMGYCGYLPDKFIDKLFIAPSVYDMIGIINKQMSEGISCHDFHVITDLAEFHNSGISNIGSERMKADNIYYLANDTDIPPAIKDYPDNVAGEVRLIKNYKDYTIAELLCASDSISTQVSKRPPVYVKKGIKSNSLPWYFFIDDGAIFAQPVLTGKTMKKADREIKPAVNGLIHIERTGKGMYRVVTKYRQYPNKVFDNVPESVLEDYTVFNSFIVNRSDSVDNINKPVLLLDWFDNRTILPNLEIISEKTAEVLNLTKEV